MHSIKCVVVGDAIVGKSCLLLRYVRDKYSTDSIPAVFDSYTVSIPIRSDTYDFYLYDTSGYGDYDKLPVFRGANILVVCFAVDDWSSFKNIQERWIPEIQQYCLGVPYILVGTKIDLRTNKKTIEKLALKGEQPISKIQGEELAKKLNAVKYVECSALKNKNIRNVFLEAVNAADIPVSSRKEVQSTGDYNKTSKSKNCTIL